MIDVPVSVKDALREGCYKKNYRFVVLNDDGTPDEEIGTIDNDNLVSESVSIDERMCSGDTLKFGLCEGSSLEFQYFDKPNITGKRVQAFVDVQYRAGIMGRIDASGSFTTPVNGSYTFELKDGSATGLYITYAGGGDMYVDFILGQTTDIEELEAGDVVTLNDPSEDALFEVSTDMWDTIPMGFFDVKKCSRQASTGIIKATCYNKLQSEYLDAKANLLIEDIASDMFVAGEVTSRGIMDALLDGYSIDYRKPDLITPSVGYGNGTLQSYSISFKMDGETFTSTELDNSVYTRMFSSNNLSNKRIQISDLDNYIAKLNQSIVEMKTAIQTKVTNPDAFWSALRSSPLGLYACGIEFDYIENGANKSAYFLHDEIYNEAVTYSRYTQPLSKLKTVNANIQSISLYMPHHLQGKYTTAQSVVIIRYVYENTNTFNDNDFPTIKAWNNNDSIDNILVNITDLPDVTLRDIATANYELHNQFGQLSRITDLFSGVELNHSRLYPADTLYPATDLYPDGAAVSGFKSMYSKLWADEGNVHKWRHLIITYKGLDEEENEKDYTLQRTVNNDGTDDYNMSDNWLFRNLVWTAEQVAEYAEAMVAKMQDMTWFPFEMWCAGLPYLETGDEIEIPLNGENYTSYVLQRQLKGIQNLQDTYINGTLDIF